MEGGLDFMQATYIANYCRDIWGEKFASMDMVEINPLIGTRDDCAQTLNVASHIVQSCLFGEPRFKYKSYEKEDTIRFQ